MALLTFGGVVVLLSYLGLSFRGWPIVGRFFSTIDNASVLRMLSVAVQEKRPLVGSLELLAAYAPFSLARSRLYEAIHQMTNGAHWCDALQRARLVTRAQATVFKSAERAGNLAWALDEMADSSIRRASPPCPSGTECRVSRADSRVRDGRDVCGRRCVAATLFTHFEIDMNATSLRKRRRRHGLSMTEMVVTVAITTVAMVGGVQIMSLASRQCQMVENRRLAGLEAGNIMEQIMARPWEEIAPGEVSTFELSDACRQALPDAKLRVAHRDRSDRPRRPAHHRGD